MIQHRETDQISRAGLAWLLLAQAAILAPHVYHAPLWLWGVWLPVLIWRWQIFRGAGNYPGTLLKIILVVICAAGLALAVKGKFGMQAMVCLLLVGFILKLLEMRHKRDFVILCYLGYFVIATQLLFFSEVYAALYALFCILLLTTALLAVNQSLTRQGKRSLRLAAILILQAVPLMLLLFLVMPRLGPLWAVPLNTTAAKTGMSDTMSPGDISELMQSDQLAFRVAFANENPRPNQLYWRGLVLSYFDGRRWSQNHLQSSPRNLHWHAAETVDWLSQLSVQGTAFKYDIIMEPSFQPWLFALAAPTEWDIGLGLGRDLWLQKREPVSQRFQYRVTSHIQYQYQVEELPQIQRDMELGLPRTLNPETRKQALAWLAEEGSPEALIQRLLAYFQAEFTYTLQPGRLGEHSVDEFLWQSRQGFCEHYASSFVVFMRAAGIPARVVVGYQGGSYNSRENYWIVRHRDAHAWAEVWLEGRGWVMIDPTAAVAPERIERGIDYSLNEEDTQLLGNTLARNFGLIAELAMRWDAFNYQWTRWVLNYDVNRQQQLLGRWLNSLDPWRIILLIFGGGAILMLLLSVWLLRRPRSSVTLWNQHYLRFSRLMAKYGLPRRTGESPRDFAQRAATVWPECRDDLNRITSLYELAAYGNNMKVIPDLAQAIRQFTPGKSKPLMPD